GPTLTPVASQSLLWNEALAIVVLEELPMELFLLLYGSLCQDIHPGAGLSIPCLPQGSLMKDHQPHLVTFQAAVNSLDLLLAQVLDMRWNAPQDFWTLWYGIKVSICLLLEPELNRYRVETQQARAPGKVLVDLCLKKDTLDETLSCLLKKAYLLHLHCQKLSIFAMPMKSIKSILNVVKLDSVQDLEVNCTWKLATLGRYMPHLGWMGNLLWLLLQLTTQFLNLPNLQELYMDSISFLEGHMHQVLRCLKTPLETLSITNCLISESDLTYLSVSLLKDLGLSGVHLRSLSLEPLQVLIERTLATLQDLDPDNCCSQLATFSFFSSPISMAMLESLLHHTMGLSKLSHMLYPAHPGQPSMDCSSTNPCPHCSDQITYDTEPILCHHHMHT
ncbi:hypothetical protein K5549_022099, partial [Capra hircus]